MSKLLVFDWVEAAQRIKAAGATEASAGLSGDWDWTGGDILRDGKPIPREETYTYLASTWATPELDIGNGPEPCFKLQDKTPGWDSGTYWPPEALAIMAGNAT